MKPLSPSSRNEMLVLLLKQLILGEITQGQLIRQLRKQVLNMSQDEYAQLVGISRKTLSDLELGRGGDSIKVLNAAFRPLGLEISLLPKSPALRKHLLNQLSDELSQ